MQNRYGTPSRMPLGMLLLLVALFGAVGCGPQAEPVVTAQAQESEEAKEPQLLFVVSLSERQLTVYRGDEAIRTDPVSVGKPGHETPPGTWGFHQVDLNPDWTPPDSDWAAGEPYRPPGHPQNPMGRARLLFDPPYTIHGTDDLDSLGNAESHGSIRVANEVALELAKLLLKEGGRWQGDDWFQTMVDNAYEMYELKLERPIPIQVVE
jgi:murein L,D-transpeptidase YcbB/YkuD